MKKNLKLSNIDKNFQLELDYYDVVERLLDAADSHKESTETGINLLLETDIDDLAKFVSREYDPVFIYNCLNTEFGLGLLVGMISGDYDAYRMAGEDAHLKDDDLDRFIDDKDLN